MCLFSYNILLFIVCHLKFLIEYFAYLEAVPGNIRQAEHFVAFMRRFVEYLKVRYSNWYNTFADSMNEFIKST